MPLIPIHSAEVRSYGGLGLHGTSRAHSFAPIEAASWRGFDTLDYVRDRSAGPAVGIEAPDGWRRGVGVGAELLVWDGPGRRSSLDPRQVLSMATERRLGFRLAAAASPAPPATSQSTLLF